MANRWTRTEKLDLVQGAGNYGLYFLQKRSGVSYNWENAPYRSKSAIYAQCQRLFQGGIARGSYSLSQIEASTGYSVTQLKRAREALNQKWKRTTPTGRYMIYEEQLEDLIAWLVNDYWSKKNRLYGCVWCSTNTIPHQSMGLCLRCYQTTRNKLLRLGLPTTKAKLIRKMVKFFKKSALANNTDIIDALQKRGHMPREVVFNVFLEEVKE